MLPWMEIESWKSFTSPFSITQALSKHRKRKIQEWSAQPELGLEEWETLVKLEQTAIRNSGDQAIRHSGQEVNKEMLKSYNCRAQDKSLGRIYQKAPNDIALSNTSRVFQRVACAVYFDFRKISQCAKTNNSIKHQMLFCSEVHYTETNDGGIICNAIME